MSDFSRSVDEVFRWPILIIIGIPEREIIIEDDWICYTRIFDCLFDIRSFFLEGELWSMHSDDDESLISVLFVPSSEIWKSTLTVDTRVCPEVDDHDFSLE